MAPKKDKTAAVDCTVITPILAGEDRYEPGDTILLTESDAAELSACGAVQLPAVAAAAPAE